MILRHCRISIRLLLLLLLLGKDGIHLGIGRPSGRELAGGRNREGSDKGAGIKEQSQEHYGVGRLHHVS